MNTFFLEHGVKISSPTTENIKRAAETIRAGGIVSFPTETVYGLGADVFNPVAVAKIFEAKQRPFFDPLIVHIADISSLHELALKKDNRIQELAQKFWPGPLTIVVEKSDIVPDIVTSGLETVAIRMPDHPVAIELIKECKTPVAAPSANPFGYISPTKAEHVLKQLGNRIDMIIDGGDCIVGVESTIIKLEDDKIKLLRPGGTSVEDIEKVVGGVDASIGILEKTEAPGQLPYHYSPSTPVKIFKNISEIDLNQKGAGFLFFEEPAVAFPKESTEILSHTGDLIEAASNLFSSLHKLDSLDLNVIYAETVPETGLGMAIMDRLVKASKK